MIKARQAFWAFCAGFFALVCLETEARAMDVLSCEVSIEADDVDYRLVGSLCEHVARALDAALVSKEAMEAEIAHPPKNNSRLFHMVNARIVSSQAIQYTYAYGTHENWRAKSERRFDDLQIDIMDAELNETVLSLLADTVRRLATQLY